MMMKLTLSLLTALTYNAFAKEDIVNDTTKPMLCIEKYDSIYEKKEINGETRNVKVKDNEEIYNATKSQDNIFVV
jgi:cell division protein FtsL